MYNIEEIAAVFNLCEITNLNDQTIEKSFWIFKSDTKELKTLGIIEVLREYKGSNTNSSVKLNPMYIPLYNILYKKINILGNSIKDMIEEENFWNDKEWKDENCTD